MRSRSNVFVTIAVSEDVAVPVPLQWTFRGSLLNATKTRQGSSFTKCLFKLEWQTFNSWRDCFNQPRSSQVH